jgi:hypothetical protein
MDNVEHARNAVVFLRILMNLLSQGLNLNDECGLSTKIVCNGFGPYSIRVTA